MSVRRIALRYAKPLLELSEEKKVLEEVFADMTSFSSLCKGNKDFSLMLKSPVIPHLKKRALLESIFKGKVNELTLTFFDIVTRKNREYILAEVAEEFILLYEMKKNLQKATVRTTFKLDKSMVKEFEGVVNKVTGKKAVLEAVVDEDILGGYVLQMGDKQIDESIASHLKEIKLKFNQKA